MSTGSQARIQCDLVLGNETLHLLIARFMEQLADVDFQLHVSMDYQPDLFYTETVIDNKSQPRHGLSRLPLFASCSH